MRVSDSLVCDIASINDVLVKADHAPTSETCFHPTFASWPAELERIGLKCIGNMHETGLRCAFSYLEQSALLITDDSCAADKHWISVRTNKDGFIPNDCDLSFIQDLCVQLDLFRFPLSFVGIQHLEPRRRCLCELQGSVPASSVPQLASMESESEVLMKEYSKMMTDMIVLCATLALSLFFWILSLTISAYSGEQPSLLIDILWGKARFSFVSGAFL